MSDKIMKRLQDWFGGKGGYRWIAAVGVIGMILIALSSLSDKTTEPTPSPTAGDITVYIAQMEERLEQMVSSIQGAGRAAVMVTLNNGVEYIYASEEKSNSDHVQSDSQVSVRDDSQTSVVTVDAGNGKEGLLVTEIQPVVRGVVVACEGAHDATVAALVNQAVRTALDITEKRVCVIPYNTEKEQ